MRLAPSLDGEETSYFEWLGAGSFEVRETAGAMHQTDRQPAVVQLVQFGFDADRLLVRVDVAGRAADLLGGGRELSLKFMTPADVRFSMRQAPGRVAGSFWDRQDVQPHWTDRGPGGADWAAGHIFELALPLADLRATPGEPIAFFVAIYDDGGAEVERHPEQRPIELVVPDRLFEARHWRT